MERTSLLSITKADKTASTDVLQVLAGTIPLDMAVNVEAQLNNIFQHEEHIIYKPIPTPYIYHPAEEVLFKYQLHLPTYKGLELFTDGSKFLVNNEFKTGCAFVAYLEGEPVKRKTFRISDHVYVFKTELWAILQSIRWIKEQRISDKISIYADSLSSLQALENSNSNEYLVHLIKHEFTNNIVLHLIKAHTGHKGNKEADRLAKLAR
ncbi:ribonuclease H-like [Parasteatoda tepidariorum]|uniref:ribonuclease H-like n=1 Tax=Parasteatoda tepidariorum TaxID=114398 RepID=UPI0039BCE28E